MMAHMVERKIIWPAAGSYVVGVSGGIDSMVLLDVLATAPAKRGYRLIVAHFDHAMRPDSVADAKFVAEAARTYNLPFESARAVTAPASEAQARSARHGFLRSVVAARPGARLILAHHQDDAIETSLLNVSRGTGWQGLAPFVGSDITRPLLLTPRRQIAAYAAHHDVWWREDETNADLSNPRNLLRREILPRADGTWQREYLELMTRTAQVGVRLTSKVLNVGTSSATGWQLGRVGVRDLSLEALAGVLVAHSKRLRPDIELDRRLVLELALFAKIGRPGRHRPVRGKLDLSIGRDGISLWNLDTAQNENK